MQAVMMGEDIYDLCIVGAGMIGSSAAKHAAKDNKNGKICLLGPKEPEDRRDTDIFGAHYDEARITRSTASDVVWAKLAKRSIDRYRQIETESGIKFYENVGCLTAGENGSRFIRSTRSSCEQQGGEIEVLSPAEATHRFPYIHTKDSYETLLEMQDAGHINPRKLVKAQQVIAAAHGCTIIEDIANTIQEISDPTNKRERILKVQTDKGAIIYTRKVLLATGVFSSFRDLLPAGMDPEINPDTQTVLFAQIDEKQLQEMKDMPSYIFHLGDVVEEDGEIKEGCYILPPVKYPDGKYYIKIGHGDQFDAVLDNEEQVKLWYRNGPPKNIRDSMLKLLLSVFPRLKPVSIKVDTCCTAKTPNHRPYIDTVTPYLGVALGGNGYAAKSCDEIGRLAVDFLLAGKWSSDLPKDELRYQTRKPKAKL